MSSNNPKRQPQEIKPEFNLVRVKRQIHRAVRKTHPKKTFDRCFSHVALTDGPNKTNCPKKHSDILGTEQ
jgi:hypothetical protein